MYPQDTQVICISPPSSYVFNPKGWVTAFCSDTSSLCAKIPVCAASMCIDMTNEAFGQIIGHHAVCSCQDHHGVNQRPSAKMFLAKLLEIPSRDFRLRIFNNYILD